MIIVYTYICVVSKVIVINEGKICVPDKNYLSGHRCKRTNMALKLKTL